MWNARGLALVLVALSVAFPGVGVAQVPNADVTMTDPALPADVFAGESFCFTTTMTNTGPPGFGPYLLVVLPPGMTFDSAMAFGGGSSSVVGAFDGSGSLADPISGDSIAGPTGGTLILVTLPVGSVVTGGPALNIEVCATLDTDVTIGVPLDVTVIPAYEFGDTATGDNGPIVGTPVTDTVTPVLAILEKTNTAPENERPPGSSWPFEYVITLDIANGATLDSVTFEDVLPPEVQWTGDPIAVTPGGCAVTDPNAPPTPGGSVSVDCGSVSGAVGGPDVEIRIPVYVTDILDETNCDTDVLVNAATVDFDFMGSPVATMMATDDDGDGETGLLVTHAAVQKGASPQSVSPGDTVTYTHSFQVTDFGTANAFVLTDILPDGTTFGSTTSLTVGGAGVAITPSVTADTPGPGQTTVVWDIGAVAGALAPGTAATLVYTATVDQAYDAAGPNSGDPVRAQDPLTNTASLAFDLAEGATGCGNATAETIEVLPVSISKSIVDPNPIPSQFMPGETVTFRLTMTIPSGDVQGIQFTDFLPLPVFDVADFDPMTDATVSPVDTGDSTPMVSTDPGTNSVVVDWSDVTVDPTRPVVLSIDLVVTISDEPFADGLALTNIMQATSSNTPGATLSDTTPVQINVGAPELAIVKGVSATSGGGTITPAPVAPIDSDLTDADAGDTVTYVITVENIGSEPAFQVTIMDPPPMGLTGCAIDSVLDGTGGTLATTGDLTTGLALTDPLTENDANPMGGGPPFGTDTALVTVICTLDGTVEPGEVLTNSASATWAATASSTSSFPPVADDATAVVARPTVAKVITGVAPGYQASAPFTNNEPVHIGEIVTYTVTVEMPEGTTDMVTLFDQLDQGLAFVDVVSVTGDAGVSTSVGGGFAAVQAGAVIASAGGGAVNVDRRLTLDFGTVTVAPDNNAANNTITVVYRVVVLNSTNNDRGDRRNNRADWRYVTDAGNQQVRVSAPNVRIREADLDIDKQLTPAFGDAGDTVQVRLTIDHNNGPSNADAFDVSLVDMLPAGVTFAGSLGVAPGCTAPPTTGPSQAGGVITAAWDRIDDGQTCTITFDVTLDVGVTAGATIENCATVTWESIRAADQPLPSAPANIFSDERTGDPADPGAGANDYREENCAEIMVTDVAVTKTLMSTSEVHTVDGEGRPGIPDLTIGEELTFELIVQLPEGMTTQLVVTDSLPFAPGVLEATAVRIGAVGGQITLPGLPMTQLQDNNLGDGLDDTAVIDFGGPIDNTPDGMVDDGDRIRIEIDAVVVDVVANGTGDEITNSALVQFGPGLDGSDTLDLDLVEPALSILKTGTISTGDAGDSVTFTLRIEHTAASTADAFDVVLMDALPPELTFTGFVGSGLGTCTDAPDVGPSEAAGTISAMWNGFPRGAVCEVVFQATLGIAVMPGETVTNTADLEWRSLDTTVNGDERVYDTDSSWPILISQPGLVKVVTATNVLETEDDQKGSADDLTIGEEVTFQATATFPDGTTTGAVLTDQLPNANVVLRVVSSRIVSIGSDLTVPDAGTNDPGDDCLPGCDGNGDGERDQAVWALGDVVNLPDMDPDPDADDQVVIEVVAVVVDNVNNQGTPGVDTDERNTATLTATGVNISDTAPVDIVAPELTVDKTVACRDDNTNNVCDSGEPTGDPLLLDAGDRVIYEVTIEHTASSTAAAFGLSLGDLLPMAGGTAFVPGTVVAVVGVAPDTVTPGAGTLSLAWDDPLPLGATYVIRYAVTIGGGAVAGETYPNEATLTWRSLEDDMAPEGQTGSDTDDAAVTVFAPTIVKQATRDSLPRTGTAAGDPLDFDLTIGELVTYNLTVVFSEGDTTNVVVTDTTQNDANGRLAIVGATVFDLGNNITTTLPGTPVITAPDMVVFDFGTVTNTADGLENADDTLTLQVTAQVVNDDDPVPPAINVDGEVLVNTAVLTFGMGSMASSSATVDVVEPGLTLTKTMGPIVDGRVKVTVVATNNGTAPGYDLTVTDVFDEAIFVPGSALPVMLPTGFDLMQTSDGSDTTVTIGVSNPSMPSEDAILDPMESVTLMFTMELQGGAMPPTTTIDNTADATLTSLPGADDEERIYGASGMDQILVPSLMVTKSAMPTSATAGQTVTFSILVENMGDAPATGLVVMDTVPVNTTSGTNPGWFVAPAPSTIACDAQPAGTQCFLEIAAPIAAGGSTTVTFAVVVDAPVPAGVTLFSNQAQVDSTELPPKDSNPVDVPIVAMPDLTIVKDDGGVSATPGGVITYTLVYDNVGTQTATGVVITETVPANTISATNPGWEIAPVGSGTACDSQPAGTTCVLAIGTVPVGGGASVTFNLIVDAPKPAGVDQIVNTAMVGDDGANGADPTPGNNTNGDATPVDAAPDLAVSKTDGGISSTPGAIVTYTINYANVGNQDATGVVLTEVVPTNTTSGTNPGWEVAPVGSGTACNSQPAGTVCVNLVGTVEATSSGMASFAVVIDNPLPTGVTQVANTVSIADDGTNGDDPTPGDNTGGDTTPVDAAPDLAVTKTDGDAMSSAGATVTYTLNYANNGNQDATGVVLTETVPANTTSGTNPGWEVSPVGSGVSCDNQAAGTVCVLSIGALPASGTGMASFVVVIDDPLPAGVETVSNAVTIGDDGANGPDQTPGDNMGDDTTPVDGAPDLTITKDDGDASTVPGGTVVYTLTYANVGTQDATGVVITETVPANATSGTNAGWEVSPVGSGVACSNQPAGTACVLAIGDLDAGDSGMATFAVVVDDPLAAGVEDLSNAVTIADDGTNGPDQTPDDNGDDDQTPVTGAPDMAIAKDDGGVTTMPGATVVYTLTYVNNGDQDATGVVITETVPANTTAGVNTGWEVSPVGSGIACDNQPAGTVCVLAIGAVAGGTGGTATFTVVIDTPLPTGVTQVANTASIADDGTNGDDPTPDDNTTDDTTPVDAAPDLTISKTDGGVTAMAGDPVIYTITYANSGDQDATGVVITEMVPANTTSGINPGWEVSPVGSGVACDGQPAGTVCVLSVGTVAAGTGGMATFAVVVDDPKPAGVTTVLNTVSIADDGTNGPDQNPDDNMGDDATPVDAAPDLTVTKDDGDATTVPGGTVVYTIMYGNVGTQTATGVVLTETVPVNTTSGVNPDWEVAPAGSGTACDNQPAGTVCVNAVGTLDVGVTGSATFTLVVDDPLPAGVEEVSNAVTIGDDGTNGDDQDPTNNDDDDQTPVDAVPDLNVSKDDGGAMTTAGGTVVYTITYGNTGNQGATGVVITEVVPANTTSGPNPGWNVAPVGSGVACDNQVAGTTCVLSIGAVPAGTMGSASFVVVIDDPLPADVDQILNSTSIGDDGTNGDDPTPDDNNDDDTTPVDAAPDLQIVKDDGGAIATPGATITYTLSYTNVGTQDATGVVLTEVVPIATVSGVNPGWEVTPVGSGVACDNQPSGTTCAFLVGDLAVGETGMASFVVVVDSPKPAGVEDILNTASIDDDGTNGPDQNPDDNSDDEQTPADAGPDLAITKDDGGAMTTPGGTVTYTISYQNVGDQDATGVVISETVPLHTTSGVNPGWEVAPAGSGVACDNQPPSTVCVFSVGDLAAGETGSVTFDLVVDNPLAAGVTEVINGVTIEDDGNSGPDQDPDNNGDDDQTPVDGMPGLEVRKSAEQPPGDGYFPGDSFVWTIELTNTGDQDLANLTLVDVLPVEVLYVPESMELDGVSLTDAMGDDAGTFDGIDTLTVEIAVVPVGGTVVLTLVTEVTGIDPEGDGSVFNQAVVSDEDGGTTTSDDPATVDPGDPTEVPIVIPDDVYTIPTLGEWGLMAFVLMLMTLGTAVLRRTAA